MGRLDFEVQIWMLKCFRLSPLRLRLFQRLMGFVLRVFFLKNFTFLIDRIKASREGLRHNFFQPRFLTGYGENSLTNLVQKLSNKLNIQNFSKDSTTSNQFIFSWKFKLFIKRVYFISKIIYNFILHSNFFWITDLSTCCLFSVSFSDFILPNKVLSW